MQITQQSGIRGGKMPFDPNIFMILGSKGSKHA